MVDAHDAFSHTRRTRIQLELFVLHEPGYEFKAVIMNKQGSAKYILLFHNRQGM